MRSKSADLLPALHPLKLYPRPATSGHDESIIINTIHTKKEIT